MNAERIAAFRDRIWEYYHDHGRDLPWRHDPTPYQVFVSEVMLQQTQVSRVLVKYQAWLEAFPDFEALAAASVADLLAQWQGMGYNRRALWLQRAAQRIVSEHGGVLPRDPAVLVALSGIGPHTAGSIAAFAYDAPTVFIETNIRRVFIHEFFEDREGVDDKELRPLIEAALDREYPREWYYALMDYGAVLAKQVPNPNRRSKHYAKQSQFEGSLRQIRGEVLRQLLAGPRAEFEIEDERLPQVLEALLGEGFIVKQSGSYHLPGSEVLP
jgi:A/G-specific adenine glycosylase